MAAWRARARAPRATRHSGQTKTPQSVRGQAELSLTTLGLRLVVPAAVMTARRLRFFLRHASIAVRIEAFEHVCAHRRELRPREVAVVIGIRVRAISALTALAALGATLRTLWSLRRFNHAVVVGIETFEHRNRPRQEFVTRNVAVVVRVSAFEAAMTTRSATMASAPAMFTTAFAVLSAHFLAR